MKRVELKKPLFAAVGLCALLAAVAVASMHVDSVDADHVTAHCASCHLVRSCAATDSCEASVLHGPGLASGAVLAATEGDASPARTRASGSRAPPAA